MNIPQILAVTGVAAAALTSATLLLPRHVTVQRSARVSASPAQVVELASSTAGYQRFNPYKASEPNLKIEAFGPAAGVGAGFRFEGKDSTGTQTIAAVDSTGVDYALDLGAMGKPQQRLEAKADGNGSLVTWTMNADMGMNPIGRVMGLFMDKFMGPVFDSGLKNINTTLQG